MKEVKNMAHQIYPDDGLNKLARRSVSVDLSYRLFVNNVTPGPASVPGDFTVAGWTGYANHTVPTTDWVETTPAGHRGRITAPDAVFTNSSGGDVTAYGYYVLDPDGDIVCACRFDSAPVTIADGESLNVTVVHGDRSGFTS